MPLHIGKLIELKAKELKIGPTEFGNKLNTTSQNIYAIYKRESIDTELLLKISVILGHNFFIELSKAKQLVNIKTADTNLLEAEISVLKNQVTILTEKNDILTELVNQQKKHITLLEKPNKKK
jgi:hypothetical protein